MKSIYENTKNLLDPTPCFDSHISKNAGKVASLASYRGFEHTQVKVSLARGAFGEEARRPNPPNPRPFSNISTSTSAPSWRCGRARFCRTLWSPSRLKEKTLLFPPHL